MERDTGVFISAAVGILMTVAAAILGARIHRKITPQIDGTMEGIVMVEGYGDACDVYRISETKEVYLKRTFQLEGEEGQVIVTALGKWKEKRGRFKIKMDRKSSEYESAVEFKNKKGRVVKPSKLVDEIIFLPISEVTDTSAVISLKRKDKEGDKVWKTFPMVRMK